MDWNLSALFKEQVRIELQSLVSRMSQSHIIRPTKSPHYLTEREAYTGIVEEAQALLQAASGSLKGAPEPTRAEFHGLNSPRPAAINTPPLPLQIYQGNTLCACGCPIEDHSLNGCRNNVGKNHVPCCYTYRPQNA